MQFRYVDYSEKCYMNLINKKKKDVFELKAGFCFVSHKRAEYSSFFGSSLLDDGWIVY